MYNVFFKPRNWREELKGRQLRFRRKQIECAEVLHKYSNATTMGNMRVSSPLAGFSHSKDRLDEIAQGVQFLLVAGGSTMYSFYAPSLAVTTLRIAVLSLWGMCLLALTVSQMCLGSSCIDMKESNCIDQHKKALEVTCYWLLVNSSKHQKHENQFVRHFLTDTQCK